MRTFARTKLIILFAAVGLLLVSSCSNPKNGSLYDPNAPTLPQPTISSVTPTGSAFAGMDTIIINGTNFSTTLAENTVLFNTTIAALVKSTATQITLVAPLVALDSVAIRVNVFGADLFSNSYQYKLRAGMVKFSQFTSTEQVYSMTTDASGNVYCDYTNLSTEAGILKITPAGVRSTYAAATTGVPFWNGIKFGPDGLLYAVRNNRAVYRFPANGGGSAALWTALPTGSVAGDFDFDQSGNVWIGGNGSTIIRVASDKSVTTYPFVGFIHSVRYYSGYLYFSAKTDAGEKIWRAQVTSSGLGTPEIYFDFSAAYPTNSALAITFSSDGVLYVATDSPDGILVVNSNKTFIAPYSAYKGIYTSSISYVTWGAADDMYAASTAGVLMKITVRDKKSAPYY